MTHIERLRQDGIRRRGSPQRGFQYVLTNGKPVPAKERERIGALKLPPAWTDVLISPSATSKLQAMGKDSAGRWQYRYHESFTKRREVEKYKRVVDFARALPKLRRRVAADLRQPGLGRDKVMACLLRILGTCFIRAGSQQYADENKSFGLATLRAKHVKVKGDTVIFDFPGKSGKQQHRELKDRQVARVVRECLKLPGRDVFKFVLDDGFVVDVRRRHINEYIQEVMGARYSAKDFRTWGGTLICACALARAKERVREEAAKDGKKLTKKTMVAAVKEVSEHLGNTPAVARDSYIYPSVLAMFEKGQVVERYFESVDELVRHEKPALHCAEKALLDMLEEGKRPAV
ncbi:DNA topoisomerase-1 [Archangium gephyra]|uniref:DNA topoisomerase n=1 Tax=Archangium gephyra TaxID=48 RepID=A0AAC8QAB5_9BACT|nr:DNA topoisomerase IB [Archangium gephyra]AKJ03441.1 DNA topoisomerase IB [Archangium gephyra]REG24052.1 DNA topoisomerase-1 [Archangium gephyra]